MLSIGFELAWDKPCEEVIPNRIIFIGLMKIHPISIVLEKKMMLEFDHFCCNSSTLSLYEDNKALHSVTVTEQRHISGLCGDTDDGPFEFRKRREDVRKLHCIFRRNRCVMPLSACGTVRLEGPVPPWDSCYVLPPDLPWAGTSPPSQAVPVLLYPFHQKALFLLPESFLLQVGPVPTCKAMEIVWFPLLAAAFYALHCQPFFLRFTHSCHQKSGLCPGVSPYPIAKWCLYFSM